MNVFRPICVVATLLASAAVIGVAAEFSGTQVDATMFHGGTQPNPSVRTIAVVDSAGDEGISVVLEVIAAAMPKEKWRTVTLLDAEAVDAIRREAPEFIVAPAGFRSRLEAAGVNAHMIVTRRPRAAINADRAVGAAALVLSESPKRSLADLKGTRAGTTLPGALDGILALKGEIEHSGGDPEKFFDRISYFYTAWPDVFSALSAKTIDVAVVPACLLEQLDKKGLVRSEDYRVIDGKDEGLTCLHTTELYPDVSLLATSSASEELVRGVTVALLTAETPWTVNVDESAVTALYRRLEVGPYSYLRDLSPTGIFKRYRFPISAAVLILLLLTVNEWRLRRIIRAKTRSLERADAERARLRSEAEEARSRIRDFERRSIVEQLSGMIAHEIGSPVGTIRATAKILSMRLRKLSVSRENRPEGAPLKDREVTESMLSSLETVSNEAQRIADIVARVRAHTGVTELTQRIDLRKVLERSVAALLSERPACCLPKVHCACGDEALVMGDALELELCFLNLLRNAVTASPADKPVMISLRTTGITNHHGGRFEVVVENCGPLLDGAELARLTEPKIHTEAKRTGSGLGLGLSICRSICERHGAAMKFEARSSQEGGGLRVRVVLDQYRVPCEAEFGSHGAGESALAAGSGGESRSYVHNAAREKAI